MTQILSNQTLPEFPDEATLNGMLDKTKARLLFKKGAGFLGYLMSKHNYIWDYGPGVTGWCNGVTIGMGVQFYLGLNRDQRVSLLGHELWHTGLDHMGRRGDRDLKDYNIAADYVINNMMDTHGFSFEGMNVCLDHQYDDMTTDQVYDLIHDANKPPPGSPFGPCDDADSGGAGDPNGAGSQPDQSKLPALSGDLRASPAGTKEEILTKIVGAMQASQMAKEAGVIPGELTQLLDKFLNPILPWEVLLMNYMSELSNDDYSWKRPNRRHEDVYLPSLLGENGLDHIIDFFDVSGSVTDKQLNMSNSELKYVHSVLQPKLLTLVTFDTVIQNEFTITDEDSYEPFEITGRGGTDLSPVLAYIKEHKPTAAVIFSDLHCHPMAEDPGVPILWIVMDNPHAKVPFGKMVHISESQYA